MAVHFNEFFSAVSLLLAPGVAYSTREVAPPIVSGSVDGLEWKDAPIDPSWVIDGDPKARVAEHSQSSDLSATTALWDCSAGAFNWYFGWDETVLILEGEVHVTGEDGTTTTLRAGDIAYFRGKTWAVWRVNNYVKKIAFVRRPMPAPLSAVLRLRNALRAMKSGEPLRGAF